MKRFYLRCGDCNGLLAVSTQPIYHTEAARCWLCALSFEETAAWLHQDAAVIEVLGVESHPLASAEHRAMFLRAATKLNIPANGKPSKTANGNYNTEEGLTSDTVSDIVDTLF